jgi:hypothetical protein
MAQNPLASMLSVNNLRYWYFGTLDDRLGLALWTWTIRDRALLEGLGIAWLAVLVGWIRLDVRNPGFWAFVLAIIAYLGVFLLFPKLHIVHNYYQVENVILLAAAAAIVIETLLHQRRHIEGYGILAIVIAGQFYTFYTSPYLKVLKEDLHNHPFYQVSQVVKNVTPPDAVVVAFGLGWAADLPYFASRRAIVVANWFPAAKVRQVVIEERNQWFGGRQLGAVVDCAIVPHFVIDEALKPIRDELINKMSGKRIEAAGCQILVPES